MHDDVEVFRGSEFQARPLHGERRCGAADQYELIGVAFKVLLEKVESFHHGKLFEENDSGCYLARTICVARSVGTCWTVR